MGWSGETERLVVCNPCADDPAIRRAAALLRAGKVVAFPTETVYGLGARLGDEDAIRSIFIAKGRPQSVPLIVHVGGIEQATGCFRRLSTEAERLARLYWPGPLTLVLERSCTVPDIVTAGGETVGVRAPDHPVALALIEALGDAIAAPSANVHNQLPPVRAEHVIAGLGGRIHAVLDGGRCPGGLESTVVDVRTRPVRVLRRGAFAADALGAPRGRAPAPREERLSGAWLSVGEPEAFATWAAEHGCAGRVTSEQVLEQMPEHAQIRCLPADLRGYAAQMYDVLHSLWSEGCDAVWVDAPPNEPAWDPIWDRLSRLASSLER